MALAILFKPTVLVNRLLTQRGKNHKKEKLKEEKVAYVFNLVSVLIKLGKFHPQCMWLTRCLLGIDSLHSFSIGVDDLEKKIQRLKIIHAILM